LIFQAKIHTKSSQNKLRRDGACLEIWINEPPVDNKANYKIEKIICEYFKCPKSAVKIIKGLKTNKKIISVDID